MLDKQIQIFLQYSQLQNASKVYDLPVEIAREKCKQEALGLRLPLLNSIQTKDFNIPRDDGTNLKIQLFYKGTVKECTIIFFHGGGYVLYDMETYFSFYQYLADKLNANIIGACYRKAPENTHPAAFNDAKLTSKWVFENLEMLNTNQDNVIIGGDSVGGQMAMLVNEISPKKFKGLFLIYPVFNFKNHYESYQKYGKGYCLDTKTMQWFENLSYKDFHNENEISSAPFLSKDFYTYLAVSEYDVLRDAAVEYINKVESKNMNFRYRLYDSLPHNFILMAGKIKAAKNALDTICADIKGLIPNL